MTMLRCRLLGHVPTRDLDTANFTARCARCGVLLSVSYDMAYGETVVVGEIHQEGGKAGRKNVESAVPAVAPSADRLKAALTGLLECKHLEGMVQVGPVEFVELEESESEDPLVAHHVKMEECDHRKAARAALADAAIPARKPTGTKGEERK